MGGNKRRQRKAGSLGSQKILKNQDLGRRWGAGGVWQDERRPRQEDGQKGDSRCGDGKGVAGL